MDIELKKNQRIMIISDEEFNLFQKGVEDGALAFGLSGDIAKEILKEGYVENLGVVLVRNWVLKNATPLEFQALIHHEIGHFGQKIPVSLEALSQKEIDKLHYKTDYEASKKQPQDEIKAIIALIQKWKKYKKGKD